MRNLDSNALHVLVSGVTHVIERNGKQAYVYLAADGESHMRLEDGVTRTGTWRATDRGYATEWDSGHKGDWLLEPTDRGIDCVSRDGGQRLKILGVMFGDSQGLAAGQNRPN